MSSPDCADMGMGEDAAERRPSAGKGGAAWGELLQPREVRGEEGGLLGITGYSRASGGRPGL